MIDDIQDPLCFVANSSDQVQEPPFHAELSEDVDEDEEDSGPLPAIEELRVAKAFLDGIKAATLRNDGLPEYVLERLLSPPQEVADASDPDLRQSLDLYLATEHASEKTYKKSCEAVLRRNPEYELLSFHRVQRTVEDLTGVVSITHDMCIDSCTAFTGLYSDLDACPYCGKARFDSQGQPTKKFHTIPIGPQIQAAWRSPENARNLSEYRGRKLDELIEECMNNGGEIPAFEDIFSGEAILAAIERGDIVSDETRNDTLLGLSIDGAQLYRSKKSDCWIWIWVIFDYAPDMRSKKIRVLIGGIIPGPNKPKNADSYLYVSIHHLAAIQKDGLKVWNGLTNKLVVSHPYLVFAMADGPGMTYLNGLNGHQGYYGCQLYCKTKGRRKLGGRGFYPALTKPNHYVLDGCDHDDVSPREIQATSREEYETNLALLMESKTQAEYEDRRKLTGISKPSLFSGLSPRRTLGVPGCFPADLMHLAALNITGLFLSLWRGTIKCETSDSRDSWDFAVLKGDVWELHGRQVAKATPYLPGSFDRPPRNPADKISSGYKAWEYLTYMYGLGPAVFYRVLPQKYWLNYCKYVAAIRIMHQRKIHNTANNPQLVKAHSLFVDFLVEYEELYYQRNVDRLHFCPQSLHALLHLATEAVRLGPQVYYTQWLMERTIGNLGEEIKQPSNPFANLCQRAVRRCQVNALKAIIPDLEPSKARIPRGAADINDGYILLRARDRSPQILLDELTIAYRSYFEEAFPGQLDPESTPRVIRWARLALPNGQIARSAWKEKAKPWRTLRAARMVKVRILFIGKLAFADGCRRFRNGRHLVSQRYSFISM